MKLSVIIPNYNGGDTLGLQLEALSRQQWSGPWEIIIADNGSTDNSRSIVERYKDRLPNLRIVDASDRRGAAHARNVGAGAATGDALVFCDADDEVAPGWLAAMGGALAQHDLVACRVDTGKLNALWLQQAFPTMQTHRLHRLSFLPDRCTAGAGTLGVKRLVHEAIGGFDESWGFLEEVDYCLRIQNGGVKIHFVHDAVIHIRYRQTLPQLYHQARRWAEYSVRLFKTYRPMGTYRWCWRWYAEQWARLLRQIPSLRSRSRHARWFWDLGWQVGRFQGIIKYRVPPVTFP